ncbi:MAG: DUF4124 domain-containing protein [Gammaproteobacteria bacterium]|jgi:hypothetical protein|nr:DUF4124 domain-containing protein [Gammaproteobacteria bacterium]
MRCLITTASLLLLFNSALLAAPIYKWVDAQGTIHFGSEPPANQAVESITSHISQPRPVEKNRALDDAQTNATTQAEIDRIVRQQVATEEIALKKYCTAIRYNLAQLENNPRVLAEVDGKPIRLSEEERQTRITELKQTISERCATVKQ